MWVLILYPLSLYHLHVGADIVPFVYYLHVGADIVPFVYHLLVGADIVPFVSLSLTCGC